MHDTPIEVFRAAADALKRADWRAAAATCDSASLAAFRRQLIERFDPVEPQQGPTVEEWMRHMPDAPRAVVEYQVAEHRAHLDPLRQFRDEMPTVRAVADLHGMTAEEVFAAWLEGRSPRWQLARQVAERRISAGTAARALEHLPAAPSYEAVGSLRAGDRVAYVVYRDAPHHTDDRAAEPPESLASLPPDEQELARDLAGHHAMITTCRHQRDGTWRMLADYGFLNVGSVGFWIHDETGDEAAGERGG